MFNISGIVHQIINIGIAVFFIKTDHAGWYIHFVKSDSFGILLGKVYHPLTHPMPPIVFINKYPANPGRVLVFGIIVRFPYGAIADYPIFISCKKHALLFFKKLLPN